MTLTAVAAGPDFSKEVRPLLARNCLSCHGPDEEAREADLRLDLQQSLLDSGVLNSDDPTESEILARLETDDPDMQMPPPDSGRELSDHRRPGAVGPHTRPLPGGPPPVDGGAEFVVGQGTGGVPGTGGGLDDGGVEAVVGGAMVVGAVFP